MATLGSPCMVVHLDPAGKERQTYRVPAEKLLLLDIYLQTFPMRAEDHARSTSRKYI